MLKMTNCNGNGECLFQCLCQCYDAETDKYEEICICGHREHNGYCPSNCCIPIECRNYEFCNETRPRWVLNCHNGMCVNCAIQLGPHKKLNVHEDCPICLEKKMMLVLKCGHKICNECWFKVTEKGFDDENEEDYRPVCPLCRNINGWK